MLLRVCEHPSIHLGESGKREGGVSAALTAKLNKNEQRVFGLWYVKRNLVSKCPRVLSFTVFDVCFFFAMPRRSLH